MYLMAIVDRKRLNDEDLAELVDFMDEIYDSNKNSSIRLHRIKEKYISWR
ncbi:hypothetical protein Holit_00141 [Hollandina sp. SP2]